MFGLTGCGCNCGCGGYGNKKVPLGKKIYTQSERDQILDQATMLDKNKQNLSVNDATKLMPINNAEEARNVLGIVTTATKGDVALPEPMLGNVKMSYENRSKILEFAANDDGNPLDLTQAELIKYINIVNKYNTDNGNTGKIKEKDVDNIIDNELKNIYGEYDRLFAKFDALRTSKAPLLEKNPAYSRIKDAVNGIKKYTQDQLKKDLSENPLSARKDFDKKKQELKNYIDQLAGINEITPTENKIKITGLTPINNIVMYINMSQKSSSTKIQSLNNKFKLLHTIHIQANNKEISQKQLDELYKKLTGNNNAKNISKRQFVEKFNSDFVKYADSF